MCGWYLRFCVYIIVHVFMLYLLMLFCYHCLFYVVLVVWLFELLIRVPIRLVLFWPQIRSISILTLTFDISVFESASASASDHYPFCSIRQKKYGREYGRGKIQSDPLHP
jgi:hypothetical protein